MVSALQRPSVGARQARRILTKQLKQSLQELGGGRASDENIHDARKRIKRPVPRCDCFARSFQVRSTDGQSSCYGRPPHC
jgi:hypothetical protein